LQVLGEMLLRTPDGRTGYARVDYFTPKGLGAWGDTRFAVTGTEGTLEARPLDDTLTLVDGDRIETMHCAGEPVTWPEMFVGGEKDSGDRLIAHPERAHVEGLLVTAGAADGDAPPAIRQALHTALQHLAAHRIDDEVHSPATGQLAHPVDPSRSGVVDTVIHAELVQRRQPLLARRRREDGCACTFGELDGGDPDAAGTRLDQHGLSGREVPELEQAIVCRTPR